MGTSIRNTSPFSRKTQRFNKIKYILIFASDLNQINEIRMKERKAKIINLVLKQ